MIEDESQYMLKGGFLDAEKQNKENPDFYYPKDLDRLMVGGVVKVCHTHERFWVKVTHINIKTGEITGIVGNILVSAPFKLYEEITFSHKAIYDVENYS